MHNFLNGIAVDLTCIKNKKYNNRKSGAPLYRKA